MDPRTYRQLIFDKKAMLTKWGKRISSTHVVEKNG